ncbi:DCC1-like thiol-disulfide oxidoreductase family protein [Methyloprofundus sp.]|uniref:DCC1-like thiol-disulfide oxidoreductase family protein n=1 Tax=Methyloprofundus sp. TaxID=2020875 RepID=UPI003D0E6CFB
MLKILAQVITRYHQRTAPAFIIGLLRILYGLVALQEIIFLLYFNHLIFDPVPYIDVEFPMIPLFLGLWGIVAGCIIVGYRSQNAIIANYIFWIVFVNFTPMQRDFDGGFDLFMISVGFFLIFMPIGRSLSLDNLRYKLQFKYQSLPSLPKTCSALSLLFPVLVCLGFLYFDSALHKLFAPHWMNGLGGWLPSSMPYYMSALDLSWMLNQEVLQKCIGYLILVFQFSFIFLFYRRCFRPIFLFVGAGLHIGITISLNIYPFGLGMLAVYILMVPFSWWRGLADKFVYQTPQLAVFYDGDCPLCNRTATIINHFDLLQGVAFKDLQTQADAAPQLHKYDQQVLLADLYAVDLQGRVFSGVDTYIQVFTKMRYLAVIAWLMRAPGIYHIAKAIYRRIADNRVRNVCDETCMPEVIEKAYPVDLYTRIFENYAQQKPRQFSFKMAKIFMILVILQLNSTVHYGFLYRFYDLSNVTNPIANQARLLSNSLLMLSTSFLGITPHALYLHDHFEGYEDLLAISYIDSEGNEQWLPFVNEQGRMLAPNWGRVHSMWANIAVTPNIDVHRLSKFIMKVTAFWGHKVGLDLNHTQFIIKHKKINSPEQWSVNLRKQNLSGAWTDIGTATWENKRYNLELQSIK